MSNPGTLLQCPFMPSLYSTVVFWPARDEGSSRRDRLLLGEQIAKDIFHPLPELEVFVRIQDEGLLIPSDFVVHSFRPPLEEAMSRLWRQVG